MLKNYFNTALRNLLHNKVYSFINIAGLSLGLACAMLIILYVKDEVSYDRFHKNKDHIYQVVKKFAVRDENSFASGAYTGLPQGPQFTAAIPEISSFVRLQNGQKDIQKGADVFSQPVLLVDSNFFSVFTFPLLYGNARTALMQPHSIVITEDLAKKQFGTTDVLNKMVMIKGDSLFEPFVVTGVAKNCPQNSTIKFSALVPLQVSKADETKGEAWLNLFLHTFIVLNEKADPGRVETKMKAVAEASGAESKRIAREKYQTDWSAEYLLEPVTDLHLSKDYAAIDGLSDASNPVFSYILVSIAIFILLIACINFVNLTIARSVRRAKEIGIRKVAGGNRKQLIFQFLGESFLLCLIAFVTAILIVELALPLFNEISNKELALSYLMDGKLIAVYVSLFIVTSVLAGFYPALILSGYNPVQTLYSRFVLGGKNRLHKSLVVVQFALASFLIIGALTVFSQFKYLTTVSLGYDDSNLVEIYKWGITPAQVQLFKTQIADAGINAVSVKDMGWENEGLTTDGKNKIDFVRETVDENYIPMLKIPVVSGRNFSKDFPADAEHSIIINETFANKAGWKNAIGREISIGTDVVEKFTVIGVVKDYHFQPLNEVIKAEVFTLKGGRVPGNLFVKINKANETASLQQIEKAFKTVFPLTSYYYTFKDQENIRNYEAEANWKRIILFAAILTIFISCIGLFGLSVLSAEKRTKEIGIRKVLGASAGSVVTILSKDFLKLVFIALIISVPLAWISAFKWLENYPYRIDLSWKLFAMAIVIVVLIATVTVSFQAVKAAFANPVKSLKTE